jgi:hypothetical protein
MEDTTMRLARNAEHLGTDNWPDTQGTDARSRAASNIDDALIAEEEGLGRWQVQLPDGDPHQVLVVKAGEDYAGACDCDGWKYHDSPCSHLITVRIGEFVDRTDIPESHDYVMELSHDDAQPETDDAEDSERDAETFDDVSVDEEMQNAPTEVQPTQPAQRESQAPTPPKQSDDAFANPLPDVEDKYAIDMGGDTYIRKAGYARLLKQQGWTVKNVEVLGSHETEWERAKYRATIVDEHGDAIANSVGTAGPPDREDMTNADMHLDELAETRAWTRAASIATGEGLTAFAELPENASEVVGE